MTADTADIQLRKWCIEMVMNRTTDPESVITHAERYYDFLTAGKTVIKQAPLELEDCAPMIRDSLSPEPITGPKEGYAKTTTRTERQQQYDPLEEIRQAQKRIDESRKNTPLSEGVIKVLDCIVSQYKNGQSTRPVDIAKKLGFEGSGSIYSSVQKLKEHAYIHIVARSRNDKSLVPLKDAAGNAIEEIVQSKPDQETVCKEKPCDLEKVDIRVKKTAISLHKDQEKEAEKPTGKKPEALPEKRELDVNEVAVLNQIIGYQNAGKQPDIKKMAYNWKITETAMRKIFQNIADLGFLKTAGAGRAAQYTAIKNPDGTPYKKMESEIIDGVKVTKCPARFADGYGHSKILEGMGV